MSENNHSKLENLLDNLNAMRSSCFSWIIRKELSAWAAVVLYLSGLFALFKITESMDKIWSLFIIALFLTTIGFLIGLFLNKQYDSIFNSMALEHGLSLWIIKLIKAGEIPEEFDFSIKEGEHLPESIRAAMEAYKEKIGKYKLHKKVLLPFKFFKIKFRNQAHTILNIEIQEAVIYDIVIISTSLLLSYILSKMIGICI